MPWSDLGTAIGLMLVIEGLLYALFPDTMRRALAQMLIMPTQQIRIAALVSVAVGVAVVWFVRG